MKDRCDKLDWPLLMEYDFRHDQNNPPLPIELKPEAKIRDYQECAIVTVIVSVVVTVMNCDSDVAL